MILLLSTSDTDLLSAKASGADYRWANPARISVDLDLPGLLDGADIVLVRILGGRRYWENGLDALAASGKPVVVVSGEQAPDADLMEASTVAAGVATQAHAYLAEGGPENLAQLYNFLSDTVLLAGEGFEPPVTAPQWGIVPRPTGPAGPRVGVLYYRAQHLAGNTAYIDALAAAIESRGGTAVPIFCASLRAADDALFTELATLDALVVTVLAAGGVNAAGAAAGGDDESWDVGRLAALDVPILQALALTTSREQWASSDDGLSPLDVATQVAIPEFDGRIITVPFSFKEIGDDGLPSYVPDAERAGRVAGLALRHARLRSIPNADKRIALMLSAYPTKHARIGNAVGLDTPQSALELIRRLADAGYDIGAPSDIPGLEANDSDAFIHAVIARGGQDPDWLSDERLDGSEVTVDPETYRAWFATLPQQLRDAVTEHWGQAPGGLFTTGSGDIAIAALRFGNLTVMVQPPRGFGENPVAIYHDPDLPPSHHYLASYRWVADREHGFGADAVIHLGKHGNLEWLPGKTLGMSAACGTDAALGDLPLIYPFLVNDPGEGTQAKRRAHAVLVDHLIPPMARAESYGDIARLEQHLDEYANVASLDPAKLPMIRQQIWTLLQAAKLDHDLGLTDQPDEDSFDDMILHVDGWLCEIKDVQIRDGLHILGQAPTDEVETDLVLAMLRAKQMWAGAVHTPGLREALGLDEDTVGGADSRAKTDEFEARARELVVAAAAVDWAPSAMAALTDDPAVAKILDFAATEIVPRLRRTGDEIENVLRALSGGFVPAGPSGSPLRGLINVLPTGRNFYSVDPKAVPSRLAWATGQELASSLVERYHAEHGEYPRSVGLSVWGTSAMRTAGDDIAEVLALLGVTPVWDEQSRRVSGLEVIGLEELGRPRIDVTVRISGFFRDAFPHVVAMLDDAVQLVAQLNEPDESNFVAAHTRAALADHGDARRATTRVFGSKPGTYGAGLLQLIDSKNWRTDADLAEVYTAWGGYAYGRGLDGAPAADDMRAAYRRIAVAAKNIDTREHDIADSDDYFQYHGGMVATVRHLTGSDPEAYVGDSTRPDSVRTRTLSEETNRVFRARVVNPRWMAAMRRHGYKGAFEMAATVDYLFGFDATAGVMADWMYDKLTENYVLDPENRKFMEESNPWALHGIAERLLEASQRELWKQPDPQLLAELQQVYLETEGDLEDR
ncbi:cobaltochelatase subunit CobN [Tsukamurella spumae]|uniref:Cobaltochelatase subunit CobN n=1 Tax=Tsukamurella spumae TaxID=44753 RepID=A0A846X8M9_9ACTN|nr:cobaltochelatase subunit CobN [Tsukamurella spumae]NKY20552.1 cobaltochelatase subunit CobN [Tsukamurella spumae]